MNSEASSSESSRLAPKTGTTLQAVLQSSDGAMDSMAVPVPLPDVILRARAGTADAPELQFRRARTADSVLRYVEQDAASEGATASDAPRSARQRCCARCDRVSSIYYIPRLAHQEPVTAETAAYCPECYGAAAS
jgi:hypothetical protein